MRDLLMRAVDQPVKHGYTLGDLARFARIAVSTAWARAADYRERYDAAWLGIAERLAKEPTRPTAGELVWSGQQEINALVHAYRHDHGLPMDGVTDSEFHTRGFQRFWWLSMRVQPGHSTRVDERIAVKQIMATLAETERATLLALAICGDYAQAAALLEMNYQTFHTSLRRARRKFFALWHEGETPSGMWGRDRRKWRQDVDEVADHRPTMVRRRASWRRQAKAAAS